MSPHPKQSGSREQLLDDFISQVAAFAGRRYGMRSAGARRRLRAESGQCPDGGGR
jgi:putative resolvase